MQKFPNMFGMALSAAAVLMAAAPAQAKVVEQEDSAFVTRDTRTVKATEREAWLALIAPAKWWNSAHTFSGDSANMMLTPQADGCFCERIPEKDTSKSIGLAGSVKHMSVILSIPDQALRMQGALGPLQSEPVNGVLTITLAKAKDGTQITFEYAVGGYMRFEVPGIAQAVDGVMSQQLDGLAKLLGEVDAPLEKAKAPVGTKPKDSDVKPEDAAKDAAKDGGDTTDKKIEPKITVDQAFGDLVVDK